VRLFYFYYRGSGDLSGDLPVLSPLHGIMLFCASDIIFKPKSPFILAGVKSSSTILL
jgi:hypothetical protein